MKVKVEWIKSNPFRHIENYPISREKVETLKESIERTDFWDNILVRESGDEFQLAYGHHRLQALKELGITEINIPVKILDDQTMLLIMAKENMDSWSANPAVVKETVIETKKYLTGILANCETVEDWIKNVPGAGTGHESNNNGFSTLKGSGIGAKTISNFLGGGYAEFTCKEALALYNNEESGVVDKEAVKEFKSVSAASNFVSEVKKQKIAPEEQLTIAKELNAGGDGASKREVTRKMKERADKKHSEVVAKQVKNMKEEYKRKLNSGEIKRFQNSVGMVASTASSSLGGIEYRIKKIAPYRDQVADDIIERIVKSAQTIVDCLTQKIPDEDYLEDPLTLIEYLENNNE